MSCKMFLHTFDNVLPKGKTEGLLLTPTKEVTELTFIRYYVSIDIDIY